MMLRSEARFQYSISNFERRLGFLRDKLRYLSKSIEDLTSGVVAALGNWQIRYGSLEDDYESLACDFYGYGYPLSFVRRAMANSGFAGWQVFLTRGTDDGLLTVRGVDEHYPVGDQRRFIFGAWQNPRKDFSMTCSRGNYESVCHALAGGEFTMASRIAALACDPPNADYLGLRSEVCKPNDQRLAYAIKHFFADDIDSMRQELKRLHPRPKADVELKCMAGMLEAIVEKNEVQFREWLGDLLDWRERCARAEDAIAADAFSISGVAFCNLALKQNAITVDDLPKENYYLPVDLILLSQDGEVGPERFAFDTFEPVLQDLIDFPPEEL